MKKALGRYAFEIVVIFIGITASFIFEEWRQLKEKDENAIVIMKSLIVELERNNDFVLVVDSSYMEVEEALRTLIEGSTLQNDQAVEVFYELLEGLSKIRLNEISSFIHGFSSADQVNILNKNKEILRYMSYLESLLAEHENVTDKISQHARVTLWPMLESSGLTNPIIRYQQESLDMNAFISLPTSVESMFNAGDEITTQLKWSYLQILRLIEINQVIHFQISNIIRELNQVVNESD